MPTEFLPSTPSDWSAALDPVLVQRLQRPAVQPGMVDGGLARGIVERSRQFQTRLPLMALATRHQPKTGHWNAQLPIVYAAERPVPPLPETTQSQPQRAEPAPASPPLVVQAKFAPATAAPSTQSPHSSTPNAPVPIATPIPPSSGGLAIAPTPAQPVFLPFVEAGLAEPSEPPDSADSNLSTVAPPPSTGRAVTQAAAVVAAFAEAQTPLLPDLPWPLQSADSPSSLEAAPITPSPAPHWSGHNLADPLSLPTQTSPVVRLRPATSWQDSTPTAPSWDSAASLSLPSPLPTVSAMPTPVRPAPNQPDQALLSSRPAPPGNPLRRSQPIVVATAPPLPLAQGELSYARPESQAEAVAPLSPLSLIPPLSAQNQAMPLISAPPAVSRALPLPSTPSPSAPPPETRGTSGLPSQATLSQARENTPEPPPEASSDRLDLEALTNQVERKLMRRLIIERERRGQRLWP